MHPSIPWTNCLRIECGEQCAGAELSIRWRNVCGDWRLTATSYQSDGSEMSGDNECCNVIMQRSTRQPSK